MSELGLADRLKLLRSKRAESSSIVQSRKRKLRELFAVATDEDAIPNHDFSNPDAPPTTPAEAKFLIEYDILQSRRLNELNLPARRKRLFDAQQLRAISESAAVENVPYAGPAKSIENGLPSLTTGDAKLNGARPYSGTTGGYASPRVPSKALPSNEAASHGADGPGAIPKQRDSTRGDLTAKDAHGQTNGVSIEPGRSQALPGNRAVLSPLEDSLAAPKPLRINSEVSRIDQASLPMELDERASPQDTDSVLDHRPSIADSSRYHDALSSPGSTAQSMLTPAVHDVSANTSPDNEGPQYLERGEDASAENQEMCATAKKGDDNASRTVSSTAPPVPDASLGTSISGVEAQLLQESAAANLSQTPGLTTVSVPPHDGIQKAVHVAKNKLPPVLGDGALADQQASLAGARALATTRGESQHHEDRTSKPSDRTPSIPGNTDVGVKAKPSTGGTVPMDIDKPDVPSLPNAAQPRQSDTRQGATTVDPTRASRVTAATMSKPPFSIPVVDRAAPSEPSAKPQSAGISAPPQEPPKSVQGDAIESPATQSEEAPTVQAPSASQLKLLANKARDKRRRSVPTVIFGKQPSKSKATDDSSVVVSRQRAGQIPSEDYFTPLFIEGFTRQSTWMKPIEKLLNQAHKTISTSDQYISILDHQACKILRRVYHLQQHDKWSLRQPVRCPEPTRPASHWDVTLQEMKWMRTDFREERKWKRAVARNLAHACAEWIHSGPAERLALQVNAVIPPPPVAGGGDGDAIGSSDLLEDALPDLDHSDSPMGNDDDALEMLVETVAPSAIFALQDDEVIFGLQPSKAADLLLENLPMHGSPLQVPKFDVSGTDYDPDAKWKRPAVPLSKFVEGEMVLASGGPPRKRRRYDYLAEDDDEDDIEVTFGSEPDHGAELQAENSAVALFNPEMKTIRDRLHAGHQFRPPTEHPMPPQSFFECRTASQWTWAEDEQLKSLVRECSYNWSLISAMASTTSTFASGAERRTPWECFERWVSLGSLEGLPNDMARTPYFKAYQSRIDAAQRIIAQQNQTAQQQVGPNGAVTPVPRRRATTTIRVERRRNQKHLALIDAMRKLAKKRETAAQKAQHAANLAAMRKANEVPRQQIQNKTPRDYSIMRWERDQALAERMAAYALRHADANARRLKQNQGVQIPATPGAIAVPQNAAQIAAANSLNNAARLNVPGQLAMAGQNRTPGRVPIQTPPGAVPAAVQARLAGGLVPPLQMAGIPQAQLQAMQQAAQHRMPMANPQPDIGLMLQARSIQNQQRAAIQMQQQQQAQQQPQPGQQQQQQQQQTPQPQQQQQAAQQQPQQQHPQQQVTQQQQPPPLPQTSQQTPQLGQANGTQSSPTPMRNVVNGLNQGAFLNNAQAMMASFNAANSAGLVTSPGAGLSMPPIPGRSPGGILSHHITQRLAELEAHYRAKHPNMAPETIRQLATEHLGRMIVQSQQQAAMNAAAGGVAQQPMNSPHQYASLLRAQQQAQAQQAAQQAAQQVAQQQVGQHQRQGSGSATPAGK